MTLRCVQHRAAMFFLMLLFSWMPASASAQQNRPLLELRPHCERTNESTCPSYNAQDPTTLVTLPLNPGATVDMDLIVRNPSKDAIASFRVWLAYDPAVLQGKTVEAAPAFSLPIPGEVDFSPESGAVKIAASAPAGQEPKDAVVRLARITFTVNPGAAVPASPITFTDHRETADGHTVVTSVSAPGVNFVQPPLGSLLVRIIVVQAPAASEASSSEASSSSENAVPVITASSSSEMLPSIVQTSSSASVSSSSSSPVAAPSSASAGATTFELLQVQNVRVGTKDTIAYVTWDTLSHPRLQGYNVYYGTRRGTYIHRRSVSVAARGAVIRDLPKGTTYFVTVRAVDDQNRESAFSKEESVEIGNPSTSTSPLDRPYEVTDADTPSPTTPAAERAPENPLEASPLPAEAPVPGESGMGSLLALLVLASAAIGTLFACRRQFTALSITRR